MGRVKGVRAGVWGLLAVAGTAVAQPYGLDSRAASPPYLSMPVVDAAVPALLSQTGAFAVMNASTLTPAAGLVPYGLVQPFWSDASLKARWISLPYDGGPGANPKIAFTTGEWTFPDGTVFVKHFDMVLNEQTQARRRLETRLLVRSQGGGVYGRAYRWRPDGTDADVISENASNNTELLTVTRADGTTRQQTWIYPRPSQCLACHTSAAGGVLGVKTRQLNGDLQYPSTGRTDNQLRTWGHLGMLDAPYAEGAIAGYPRLAALGDATKPMLDRVRSYIDSNCASCHRPGGVGLFDARHDTPIAQQGIFGHAGSGPNKLVRRDPGASRILARSAMTSLQGGMPPLAKDVVDTAWIQAVTAYLDETYDLASVAAYGDNTKVRVTFNQPVEAQSATTPANYAIAGIAVSGATLSADARLVTLDTSPLAASTPYELVVNNVRAAAAPAGPIWPDTRRAFQLNVLDPGYDEDGDGMPNGVEVQQARNPVVKDNDVFGNAKLFAMQQYRDFLGREGDWPGIDYWTFQVGPASRAFVIESFFKSEEFQGMASPLARLYFAYFLRVPDYAGLDFWLRYRRAGHTLDEISAFFAQSAEFQTNYGALDNGQFVTLVYQNVLGRAPDAGGFAFWKNELDTGARTRGQVMLGFSESEEYGGSSGSMVYVAMMYFGMLRREPDPQGFAFWVDYRNQGNSGLALIDAFLGSPEYRSRFLP